LRKKENPIPQTSSIKNQRALKMKQIIETRHYCRRGEGSLRALATETAGKLNVLGLDGDALGVDS